MKNAMQLKAVIKNISKDKHISAQFVMQNFMLKRRLSDSGKQNGFKALIYLHRYTPDTIGNLRMDYLHRMQQVYESEIKRMQDMIDHSTNAREVAASTKRKEIRRFGKDIIR